MDRLGGSHADQSNALVAIYDTLDRPPDALGPVSAGHTWASLALESGKSVRWVAEQLGHADPALTLEVYAHVIPNEEPDRSFLDFGGSGRPYTAPPPDDDREDAGTSAVSVRNASEECGAPSTTRTCDLQVRNPPASLMRLRVPPRTPQRRPRRGLGGTM